MKNKKLRRKIAITNIKRIVSSFIFINIMPIYNKVVLGTVTFNSLVNNIQVTCYSVERKPIEKKMNLLVVLVPIAIVIILVIAIVIRMKRCKKKKTENENDNKN